MFVRVLRTYVRACVPCNCVTHVIKFFFFELLFRRFGARRALWEAEIVTTRDFQLPGCATACTMVRRRRWSVITMVRYNDGPL